MNLTADSLYDTITEKVVFEGENMLARFHDENSMYLYCVTDRSTANIIINNRCSYPIKLYENPYIANKVVENTNISNKVTLRFAVNLNHGYVYDSLTMTPDMVKEHKNLSVEQYIKQCSYTRTINKTHKVIEYTINSPQPIINVQIV